MSEPLNRQGFIKQSVLASGAALGLAGRNETAAVPDSPTDQAAQTAPTAGMPTGKIGNLTVSRLISGGNLISGWAHSRDLIYLHQLMKQYNTEKKVLETLALLEENGVNT
ncbi:MAG: hypothetical protein JW810_03060, partial [Sedimentisphaerales bacterium]|nr:hypothetical protein [Sedimentisphaerales bacterium]